jgi:hypothetical protein
MLSQQHLEPMAHVRVSATRLVQEPETVGGVLLLKGGDKDLSLVHGTAPLKREWKNHYSQCVIGGPTLQRNLEDEE